MQSKLLFPLIAFCLFFFMIVYFLVNSSYQQSLEAKYYYTMGDYKHAYSLANEAFSLNKYNRMASTIMAQSNTSVKYQDYIEQAKTYLSKINKMAAQETLSDADRARIKMMSQIVVDSYSKLAASVVTDKALVNEAKKYHDNFEKLLEKVNR